jgi:hypothetical protein
MMSFIMADFLPKRDAVLLGWSSHFLAKIEAERELLALSPQAVAQYRMLHENFAAALAVSGPTVRSVVSTTLKNSARSELKSDARRLAMLVKGNANVTPGMRSALGINLGIREARRVAEPSEEPVVVIRNVTGTAVTFSIAGRGRPPGTSGAVILTNIGHHPADPDPIRDWTFHDTTSARRIRIQFAPDLRPGTPVSIIACWVNPRLQRGPWSRAATTLLQGAIAPVLTRQLAQAA